MIYGVIALMVLGIGALWTLGRSNAICACVGFFIAIFCLVGILALADCSAPENAEGYVVQLLADTQEAKGNDLQAAPKAISYVEELK